MQGHDIIFMYLFISDSEVCVVFVVDGAVAVFLPSDLRDEGKDDKN